MALTEEMLNAIEDAQDQLQKVRDAFDDFDTNQKFESANQRTQLAECVKPAGPKRLPTAPARGTLRFRKCRDAKRARRPRPIPDP